jgi:hypothetical protein
VTPEFYTYDAARCGLEASLTAAVACADLSGPPYAAVVTALLRIKAEVLAIPECDGRAPDRSRSRRVASAATGASACAGTAQYGQHLAARAGS